MEHTKNYDKVKNYYVTYVSEERLWNIDRVHSAVGKWITEDEYEEITSFIYPNKN